MNRVCIIAPRAGGVITGIETVNRVLAKSLLEMGHAVDIAVPTNPFGFSYLKKLSEDTGCLVSEISGIAEGSLRSLLKDDSIEAGLARQLQPYRVIFISGAWFNYGRIIRAALGRKVIIIPHGLHVNPLEYLDATELNRPNVTYACINWMHMLDANRRGAGARAVMFDLPIPFGPRTVKAAGNYCVAVGTEKRKRLSQVAEVAAALGMECRVYGPEPEPGARAPGLRYMKQVPHEELLETIAGAAFLIHMALVEGRPMAVLEALGLGVRVIIPDAPLYREFVPDGNVFLDPGRPFTEQLAGFAADNGLKPLRAMANRRELHDWAHGKYGDAAFKKQLEEIMGVAA